MDLVHHRIECNVAATSRSLPENEMAHFGLMHQRKQATERFMGEKTTLWSRHSKSKLLFAMKQSVYMQFSMKAHCRHARMPLWGPGLWGKRLLQHSPGEGTSIHQTELKNHLWVSGILTRYNPDTVVSLEREIVLEFIVPSDSLLGSFPPSLQSSPVGDLQEPDTLPSGLIKTPPNMNKQFTEREMPANSLTQGDTCFA